MYTVRSVPRHHHHWQGVSSAVKRRTKPNTGSRTLTELYEVRWRYKPFPWSWTKEFRPNRRWFYHGTRKSTIEKILDEGFKIGAPSHGRMLGNGVYLTYHTNKCINYGPDGYVLSVMIYTPRTLLINPQKSINQTIINGAPSNYDAIEVRTNAVVGTWTMLNHEICVFDTRRVIPRFICKIQ